MQVSDPTSNRKSPIDSQPVTGVINPVTEQSTPPFAHFFSIASQRPSKAISQGNSDTHFVLNATNEEFSNSVTDAQDNPPESTSKSSENDTRDLPVPPSFVSPIQQPVIIKIDMPPRPHSAQQIMVVIVHNIQVLSKSYQSYQFESPDRSVIVKCHSIGDSLNIKIVLSDSADASSVKKHEAELLKSIQTATQCQKVSISLDNSITSNPPAQSHPQKENSESSDQRGRKKPQHDTQEELAQ